MSLRTLTPQQVESIRNDLLTLGAEGSNLLVIPPIGHGADSHEYIRDIVLAFLRSMFRNMSEDSPYRWDADPTRSTLIIQYADPRNLDGKSAAPAITVELGPFTWGNQSINNLLGLDENGAALHTDLRNGSVIVRCRSSVKLEADSLAAVVAGAFHYMHNELESLAGFTWIDAYTANPSSGELQTQNKQGEAFVANVVLNVHYQETWKRENTKRVSGKVVFNENPKGAYLD
jgi:hypothetical protein